MMNAEDELESEEIFKNLKKMEEEGKKNILRYFDRIHDKLFTFNNILIGGYLAFSKIGNQIPLYALIFPLGNLCFLIYLEYRMMENSRYEAQITSLPMSLVKEQGKQISKTTRFSLLAILITLTVLIIFLYFIFSS